jgi:hypothetical protein
MDLPIVWIPYADTGVQTACRNLFPVERDRVNLAKVPGERAQALAFGYAPDLRSRVVAARHNDIAVYLEASDASLMTNEYMLAQTLLQVPDA